jgi:hypothetical protein
VELCRCNLGSASRAVRCCLNDYGPLRNDAECFARYITSLQSIVTSVKEDACIYMFCTHMRMGLIPNIYFPAGVSEFIQLYGIVGY